MKKMKLTYIFLMAIMILSSCSNDDDSNSSDTSASIIGKWKLIAESYGGQTQDLSDCEKQQTMEFFTNGTVENYYVDNDPCDFSTITVEYNRNNNQLTFSIDGEGTNGGTYVITSTIEVLNDTTLRYKSVSDNEDGTYPESEQYTQTYIRI
jgi:PBP1b-binding outer membrane lipoprotein LpoB